MWRGYRCRHPAGRYEAEVVELLPDEPEPELLPDEPELDDELEPASLDELVLDELPESPDELDELVDEADELADLEEPPRLSVL